VQGRSGRACAFSELGSVETPLVEREYATPAATPTNGSATALPVTQTDDDADDPHRGWNAWLRGNLAARARGHLQDRLANISVS
jgi:hypothetical protein